MTFYKFIKFEQGELGTLKRGAKQLKRFFVFFCRGTVTVLFLNSPRVKTVLEILSWALHKPKVDPAPLARSSQSLKEETCLVPVYSHKVGQRVGLIARSAHVDARTVRVQLTHMLAVWSNEPKQLSLFQHRNVQTKNTNIFQDGTSFLSNWHHCPTSSGDRGYLPLPFSRYL